MNIPDSNNVYGYFTSQSSLEELADVLRRTIYIAEGEVNVKISSFNGEQTIRIFSVDAEFESTKYDNKGKYLFNGAIAGSKKQVIDYVNKLYEVLKQHNYNPAFEIYDSEKNIVTEFNT